MYGLNMSCQAFKQLTKQTARPIPKAFGYMEDLWQWRGSSMCPKAVSYQVPRQLVPCWCLWTSPCCCSCYLTHDTEATMQLPSHILDAVFWDVP